MVSKVKENVSLFRLISLRSNLELMMELGQLTKIRGCVLRKQLHNLLIVHFGFGGWRARELYLLFEKDDQIYLNL